LNVTLDNEFKICAQMLISNHEVKPGSLCAFISVSLHDGNDDVQQCGQMLWAS